MKNKRTETNLRSGIGLIRHLIGGLLCLAVTSLFCARASAQNLFAVGVNPTTGGFTGSIDELTPNGLRSIFASGLTSPFTMAFDSGGNLFVADGGNENAGSGAVYKFTPAGVRTTFALGLSNPAGLAFDSAGNLFVAEFGEINGGPGTGRIYKFTPNGVRTTFASGLFEPQGLAFDRTGNLFVAVSGEGRIYKFTSTGVRSTFAVGVPFPFALAFDSRGNLFVAYGGDPWDYPTVDGKVYKFTPTGARSIFASGLTYPDGLAIDGADNLFVADVHWEQQRLAGSILKISPSGARTTFASIPVGAMAFQRNLAPTPAAPTGNTNPASYIASFSGRLGGSVDPHGLTTNTYFQYGTTTSYGLTTAIQSKTGNTDQNVNAIIGGLTASTTYHFRIVAANSLGTLHGSDRTFTTLSLTGPPVANTNHATNVASSSATVNGSVDPHGLTTTVHFQYGTTASYGHTTANQTMTGNSYQNVAANISGLTANTQYYFRMVATNSAGTRYGGIRTFCDGFCY